MNPFIKKSIIQNRLNISNVYLINDEVLGRGAFGEVRIATHRASGISRVVKTIIKKNKSASHLEKVRREITIVGRLDHPNIHKVYEYFEEPTRLHIIGEYLTGGHLSKGWSIDRKTEIDLMWIMRQILSGVAYCHRLGIVHRDLKPENILYISPMSAALKIIDFGMSVNLNSKYMKNTAGTVIFNLFLANVHGSRSIQREVR